MVKVSINDLNIRKGAGTNGRCREIIIELFDFISITLNGIYAPCMVFSCIGG